MWVARILLLLLVGMCVTIGVAVMMPEPEAGHVTNHPDYPTMTRTVAGPESTAVRIVGGVFGVLQIGVFVCAIALGIHRHLSRPSVALLVVGTVLYLAAMLLLVAMHLSYGGDTAPAMFLGFPLPTAVMLYVLWPVPMWFVVLYVWKFNTWVLGPDAERKFRALVDSRRCGEDAR